MEITKLEPINSNTAAVNVRHLMELQEKGQGTDQNRLLKKIFSVYFFEYILTIDRSMFSFSVWFLLNILG